MSKKHIPSGAVLRGALLLGIALVLLTTPPAVTDDRDLLRFDTANPYLFILLDTSTSMTLKMGVDEADGAAEGFADDPASRLYGAKAALFEVFKSVDDVNFGFAGFNQDELHVVAKHWLYYDRDPAPADWPLDWPIYDGNGLTQDFLTVDTDNDGTPDSGDGIRDNDVQGDAWTFGPHFDFVANAEAGSCDAPLDLDDPYQRAQANAFPKLGRPGSSDTTMMWVAGGNPRSTYRLIISRGAGFLGDFAIQPQLELKKVTNCQGNGSFSTTTIRNPVLVKDPYLSEFLMVDNGPAAAAAPTTVTVGRAKGGNPGPPNGGGNNSGEGSAGWWNWSDARSTASCGSSSPFSGKGWEGNYDGGVVTGTAAFDANVTDIDKFCSGSPTVCRDLRTNPTQLSGLTRALDRGDVLPFDWTTDHKTRFLQRLAPNYPFGTPDFRVAPHLSFDAATGLYLPNKPTKPIMATGDTPLAKAINDFRCWYMGDEGPAAAGKCGANSFFDQGWAQAACTYDSRWGCRRPYLIVISDGQDNCAGENPAADTAAMFSGSGVRTWGVNLGHPSNCDSASTGSMKPITTNGRGECVNVSNKEDLMDTLNDILGKIREENTAFASAAVPTVQATADQSIFLSNFVPLQSKSVWDGHLLTFLNPIPLDDDGKPDTTETCASKPADQQSACFVWDAGATAKTQVNAADPLGTNANQRRVYYSKKSTSGNWNANRRLFDPTNDTMSDGVRYDLWRGMGLIPPGTADGALTVAQEIDAETTANSVMTTTFALKSATIAASNTNITYIIGDVFHSDPVAVGSPASVGAFAADTNTDPCTLSGTKSYRCFHKKHQFRRKAVLVGSNDGMVHSFNAGTYDATDGKFDNGTGHELFAYMPRAALPKVRELAEGTAHKFSVDGGLVVSDVFIDPGNGGTPVAADREWRTVALGGLREGGRAYYALDVTQPDNMTLTSGEFIPDDGGNYVPSCLSSPGASCGPVPYGSALWEFDDTHYDSVSDSFIALDENRDALGNVVGNGRPDLGYAWSKPNVGVVQFCAGNSACDPEDAASVILERHVVVIGGGLDPANKTVATPDWGNFLYIIDIETGNTLYKRELAGSTPSEPAAVDANGDGILDRIYMGTTAGYMYRIDLGLDSSGELPALATETVLGVDGNNYDVDRVPTGYWDPRVVYDTVAAKSATDATLVRRPLYQRPSVLFVAKLENYALAFGTGDREDLWALSGTEEHFVLVVDDTTAASSAITATDLTTIDASTTAAITGDLVLDSDPGERGWVMTLEPDERVITDAFALSGVTIFSSFQPETPITDGSGNPISTDGGCSSTFQKETDNFCSRGGQSRLFLANTTNGNGFMEDLDGNDTRFAEVADFVTNPYSELGQTKNLGAGDAGGLTLNQLDVMEALKELFPDDCKFANYRIDVRTIAADTSIQHIASVPVCMIERNWKEF